MMEALIMTLCVITLTNSPADARHMGKRSDDQGPLENVIMKTSADLTALTATVNALTATINTLQAKLDMESRHTSFLAQFSNMTPTTPSSGPFKFDRVIFNDGNNYDPMLGVFTAPFAGVYVISVKLYMHGTQTIHPNTDIMVNGHTFDRMGFDRTIATPGHGDNSHSTSVNVKLEAGDKVWVQTGNPAQVYHLWGQFHSYFSGALITAL